jgi:hypothetical protein
MGRIKNLDEIKALARGTGYNARNRIIEWLEKRSAVNVAKPSVAES